MDSVKRVANTRNLVSNIAEARGDGGWWSGVQALGQVPSLSPDVWTWTRSYSLSSHFIIHSRGQLVLTPTAR